MGKEEHSLYTRRIYAFLRPFIAFIIIALIGGFLKWLIPALFALRVIGALVYPLIATLSVFACRKLIDKRSFVSLGLRQTRFWCGDILLGLGTIFLATVVIFLANWGFGWIEPKSIISLLRNITIFAALGTAGITLFSALVTGWTEELIFRGYMFKNMAWVTNIFFSAFLTSAIFGISHIGNYLQQKLAAMDCLSIAVDAALGGLLMVFAYIRTRNLWMSIGLHTGWNFLMGRIMGLGIPQGSRPGFVGNLFSAPGYPMSANDIAILGIAAVFVFLITMQRNPRVFHRGISKLARPSSRNK